MRMRLLAAGILLGLVGNLSSAKAGESWPQFRGVNATGVATSNAPLPDKVSPDSSVIWKVPLPPGHSSPTIFGDRIFLTAEHDSKLMTIGIDRATGKILWEAEAPYEKLESIHRIGSHCQATPATDGERVVTLFGSSGLYCYDRNGKALWKRPMGPFRNEFGAGTSPIIVDDRVILCQDHDTDSFLMALDKHSGEVIWKVDRSEFPRNYCTPVIWETAGHKQIVVAATLRVVGYDFETGQEEWTVRGISRTVCMTPAVGSDGNLYVAGWAAGGDTDEPIRVEPFDDLVDTIDRNKNGTFEEKELPEGAVKQRFGQVDRDKNESITRAEYEFIRTLFAEGKNVVVAIRPGGIGDVTGTHVLWEARRYVPFCASPLYYEGNVFAVKDGGIFSSWNSKTGEPLKQGRIPGTGSYYSSPVAGDGKIYLVNEEGKLTVVRAAGDWSVLSTSEFGEDVYATPALLDGKVYLRTKGHLYCFGATPSS